MTPNYSRYLIGAVTGWWRADELMSAYKIGDGGVSVCVQCEISHLDWIVKGVLKVMCHKRQYE